MTTADRVDFTPWAASVVLPDTETEVYTGKHRRPGARALGLVRMFYRPRHLNRVS